MNWFKRNWIDVLMVTLILSGVGGFLTLLLRGAGLLPNAATTPAQTATSTTASAAPNAPVADNATDAPSPPPSTPNVATPDVTTPDVNVAVSVPPAPPTPAPIAAKPATKPVSTKPATTTKPQQDIRIEIKPEAKPAIKPAPAPTAQTPKPTQTIATKPITKPTVAKPTTTSNPAPSSTSPFNAKRSDFLKNHRVAVGTYSTLARAESIAANLRAKGLPARAFTTGNSAVVVIGPYRYEKSARRILERVSGTYPGAILYRPNGTRVAATSTTRQANTTKPATPTEQAAPNTPTSPTYLQVGAFKNKDSINALRDKLAVAGYAITLRSQPDGLVRLLVGPFSGQALQNATQDLRARGLNPIAKPQ